VEALADLGQGPGRLKAEHQRITRLFAITGSGNLFYPGLQLAWGTFQYRGTVTERVSGSAQAVRHRNVGYHDKGSWCHFLSR
jgi:hypothetical protein